MKLEISNQEMAKYMSMIFNSDALKELYKRFPLNADDLFCNLGNVLGKYYISTGDNSMESAEKIISEYVAHEPKTFLRQSFMPMVEASVAKELGLNQPLSIKDRIRIVEHVRERNSKNKFYTHCFPEAIYDDVSTNGLDISKELFQEEFSVLSKISKTPFMTGKLNYCELSAGALGYATLGIPERVRLTLVKKSKQNKGEPMKDFLERALREQADEEIINGKITEDDRESILQAGQKIIDFYLRPNSCVAFFKKEDIYADNSRDTQKNDDRIKSLFIGKLGTFNNISWGRYVSSIAEESISKIKKNPDMFEKVYAEFFERIKTEIPSLEEYFDDFIEDTFAEILSRGAISNYEYSGNVDGYCMENGKLSRGHFEIATFTTPREVAIEGIRENEGKETLGNSRVKGKKEDYTKEIGNVKKVTSFFDKVIASKSKIERIEQHNISYRDANGRSKSVYIFLVTDDSGAIRQIEHPWTNQLQDGKQVFMLNRGPLKQRLVSSIELEIEDYSSEDRKKIVEEYKNSVEEYDEDYVEDDAISWKANQIYEQMSEEERNMLIAKQDRFMISYLRDCQKIEIISGSKIVPSTDDVEVLYSEAEDAKYNILFEAIRDKDKPLINPYDTLMDTRYYKQEIETRKKLTPQSIEAFSQAVRKVNSLYQEVIGTEMFQELQEGKEISEIKARPSKKVANMIEAMPKMLDVLRLIAKSEHRSGCNRMSYLDAAVFVCEQTQIYFNKNKRTKYRKK